MRPVSASRSFHASQQASMIWAVSGKTRWVRRLSRM